MLYVGLIVVKKKNNKNSTTQKYLVSEFDRVPFSCTCCIDPRNMRSLVVITRIFGDGETRKHVAIGTKS